MSNEKKNGRLKEFFRKRMVSLKRQPQIIPMLALVVAFLVYSLNLTSISNTTAKIQGAGMGLCGFVTMLFSILSFVCMLNAFPKRKKANVPMLVLMYLMFAAIIAADFIYRSRVMTAVTRPVDPIKVNSSTMYIMKALSTVNTHMILVAVVAVLVAFLPLYGKMLRKIKTSIDVEDNGELGEIDISGEE